MKVTVKRTSPRCLALAVSERTVALAVLRGNGWHLVADWIDYSGEGRLLGEAEAAAHFLEVAARSVRDFVAAEALEHSAAEARS